MRSPLRRVLLEGFAFLLATGVTASAVAGPGPVRAKPLAPMATTQTPNAASVLASVQAFYAGIDHVRARFHQEVTNTTFGRSDLSEGTLWIARPGKMRWDYRGKKTRKAKASVARSFISNGSYLYVVDHDNQQVIQKDLGKDLLPTAVTFLYGRGDLAADFTPLIDGSGRYGAPGDHVLALTPKVPSTQYQRLYLVVDPGTFQVKESIIVDGAGNTNDLRFDKTDSVAPVKDSWFELDPRSVPTYRVLDAGAAPPSP